LENQMIAELYCMSIETVKSHVKRIMAKLAAKNRTHVVAIALRQGIVD
jgi:DNA-binding CsgD family transcriptional regulator